MKRLIFASVAITIVLILCAFDDFLSLHDIKADYVSKSILGHLEVETSKPLPPWTDTPLEWASVTVSYMVRSVLLVSNLVILHRLTRRVHAEGTPASADPAPSR